MECQAWAGSIEMTIVQKLELFEFFKRKKADVAPNFLGRLTYCSEQLPPLRAYFHNGGLVEAFGEKETIEKAKEQLLDSLVKNIPLIGDGIYLIAAVWGENGNKMIDLFKYSHFNGWPGNPTISAFVIKNGVYIPERKDITCGDTLIVLGLEEKIRRRTVGVSHYINSPPPIEYVDIDLKQ